MILCLALLIPCLVIAIAALRAVACAIVSTFSLKPNHFSQADISSAVPLWRGLHAPALPLCPSLPRPTRAARRPGACGLIDLLCSFKSHWQPACMLPCCYRFLAVVIRPCVPLVSSLDPQPAELEPWIPFSLFTQVAIDCIPTPLYPTSPALLPTTILLVLCVG